MRPLYFAAFLRRNLRQSIQLAILATGLLANYAKADTPVDLIGTWHVLIHYRDAASNHPDFDRWEDRLWVFKPSEKGIRWTDYPIVVFKDTSGRFERRKSGQNARVLAHWKPNPGQRQEIHSGLAVNKRGSQSKGLFHSARQQLEFKKSTT